MLNCGRLPSSEQVFLNRHDMVMLENAWHEGQGLCPMTWQMLEDAKYDSGIAEYKQGRVLMPVVIGFSVTRDNQLKGVEILQSSGDPEIDRSVVYGFKRAAFWNKSGETVPGRFTYRF